MDAPRFDDLTRRFVTGLSRRRVLAGLGVAALGSMAGRSRGTARVRDLPQYDCIPTCCNVLPDGPCCGFGCRGGTPLLPATFTGIAGNGAIVVGGRVIHFNLFASLLSGLPEQPADATVPFAQVRWSDPEAGLTLASVGPAYYGSLAGVDGGREVVGMMRVGDLEGQYAFILTAVATDPSSNRADGISLHVGDGLPGHPAAAQPTQPTGFSYAAEGPLVGGDLQLLQIDMSQQVVFQPAS